MAIPTRAKRCDLETLAIEMEISGAKELGLAALKKAIITCPEFEQDWIKAQLEDLITERKKLEAEEREEKKRREQQALEFEHELKKIELSNQSTRASSPVRQKSRDQTPKIPMPQFDAEKGDLARYLDFFEGQAERVDLEQIHWVAELYTHLPPQMTDLIAREEKDVRYNYEHIKRLLIKRYQLSAEGCRIRFRDHQRKPNTSWADFGFEVRKFFEAWIDRLQVTTFQELKNLMVTDQIKHRTPAEIKTNLIDCWGELKTPEEIIEKLDNYEMARRHLKKPYTSTRTSEEQKPPHRKAASNREWGREERTGKPMGKQDPTDKKNYEIFDRRRPMKCFGCDREGHYFAQCPKRNKVETISHVWNQTSSSDDYAPYQTMAVINKTETLILRDSGASVDLIDARQVAPSMYIEGKTLVKTPVHPKAISLPLARVEMELSNGERHVTTAAVTPENLGYYLMGNKTAKRIQGRMPNIHEINAKIMCRQPRRAREANSIPEEHQEESVESQRNGDARTEEPERKGYGWPGPDEDETGILPPKLEAPPPLMKVRSKECEHAQTECHTLESLMSKACGEAQSRLDASRNSEEALENKIETKNTNSSKPNDCHTESGPEEKKSRMNLTYSSSEDGDSSNPMKVDFSESDEKAPQLPERMQKDDRSPVPASDESKRSKPQKMCDEHTTETSSEHGDEPASKGHAPSEGIPFKDDSVQTMPSTEHKDMATCENSLTADHSNESRPNEFENIPKKSETLCDEPDDSSAMNDYKSVGCSREEDEEVDCNITSNNVQKTLPQAKDKLRKKFGKKKFQMLNENLMEVNLAGKSGTKYKRRKFMQEVADLKPDSVCNDTKNEKHKYLQNVEKILEPPLPCIENLNTNDEKPVLESTDLFLLNGEHDCEKQLPLNYKGKTDMESAVNKIQKFTEVAEQNLCINEKEISSLEKHKQDRQETVIQLNSGNKDFGHQNIKINDTHSCLEGINLAPSTEIVAQRRKYNKSLDPNENSWNWKKRKKRQ